MINRTPELFGTPKHSIMDPVHGSISLFSHEKKIISHPMFLRLGHIKQNDILFYVFPGATHCRFEHCIGTMHIASRIFKNMIRNYLSYKSIDVLTKTQIEAIQYLHGCLRIAALLHDIGHMPFSHQFESSEVGRDLFSDTSFIKEIWSDGLNNLCEEMPKELKHEHFSLIYASDILKNQKDINPHEFKFEPEDIIGMMESVIQSFLRSF